MEAHEWREQKYPKSDIVFLVLMIGIIIGSLGIFECK